MTITTIHEFKTDDPRARVMIDGKPYRAVCLTYDTYCDASGEVIGLAVHFARVTKRGGRDFANAREIIEAGGSVRRDQRYSGDYRYIVERMGPIR